MREIDRVGISYGPLSNQLYLYRAKKNQKLAKAVEVIDKKEMTGEILATVARFILEKFDGEIVVSVEDQDGNISHSYEITVNQIKKAA